MTHTHFFKISMGVYSIKESHSMYVVTHACRLLSVEAVHVKSVSLVLSEMEIMKCLQDILNDSILRYRAPQIKQVACVAFSLHHVLLLSNIKQVSFISVFYLYNHIII